MRVVWQSFEGRYSDSPKVLYESWLRTRAGDRHVWLADAAHRDAFPAHAETVAVYGRECVAALEHADVVIANTHTDVEWVKPRTTLYLQTWHGTPLKRIHHDVLWAPPGRLERLSRDVARWDVLLSPNAASTPRLRAAFQYDGEVMETGYPRNDLLSSSGADLEGRRVRKELGVGDEHTVVLLTPTWRDDVVFAGDDTCQIELGFSPAELADQLGTRYRLLLRGHPFVSERLVTFTSPAVIDVSQHPDVAELYLAADVMVTDYSSTMFDFAITGKPMVFFAYDLDRFRDHVRGFYFDLSPQAPGPVVRTADELAEALGDVTAVPSGYLGAYRAFRERYCHLEDGQATERVLERIWSGEPAGAASRL
jgi:CDP-glycerol glycerophosphotransferase